MQKAFLENNLKDVRFEFGIASFDKNGIENFFLKGNLETVVSEGAMWQE